MTDHSPQAVLEADLELETRKRNLLMLAETMGRIQNELQWVVEWIRTEAEELGVELDEKN
jgi:hypothetical protein